MANLPERRDCTGCAACCNACHRAAVSMRIGDDGFAHPVIDRALCVNCGACADVCPLNCQLTPDLNPKCYAARTRDLELLKQSSSGGIFSELALRVLGSGGCVFGCALDEGLCARHVKVESVSELGRLRGSKYVQSDIGLSFREAKAELQKGRKVLFSGTPCQIAGLKCFLRKEYENLFTVEVLCFGVPSPGLFEKLKREACVDSDAVSDFKFRDKSVGWNGWWDKECSYRKGGRLFSCGTAGLVYNRAFLSRLTFRDSCFNCRVKSGASRADVSIGDFWGIERTKIRIADDLGISAVLCHSKAGGDMIDSLDLFRESVGLEEVVRCNSGYHGGVRQKPKGRCVFKFLTRMTSIQTAFMVVRIPGSFKRCMGKAIRWARSLILGRSWGGGRMLVGIRTYDWSVILHNYGTFFQHIALREAVKHIGFEPFRMRDGGATQVIVRLMMPFRSVVALGLSRLHLVQAPSRQSFSFVPLCDFFRFFGDYRRFVGRLFEKQGWQHVAACVVGSDQIWNNNTPSAFLENVPEGLRKIAYAVSADWASAKEKNGWVERVKGTATGYSAISIRELDGAAYYEKLTGRAVDRVCDPVLLFREDFYVEKFGLRRSKGNAGTTVGYFVNADCAEDVAYNSLIEAADMMGKRLVFVGIQGAEKIPIGKYAKNPSPSGFLQLFYEADHVITNSFHGLLFALLFNKKFAFLPQKPVPGRDQNMRQREYLDFLGVQDRIVSKDVSGEGLRRMLEADIDWTDINSRIESFRSFSRDWLKDALKGASV